jgi:hypothetical protein
MKSDKAKQNGKKELKKLKTKAKDQNQHSPKINSPNTLNASSPP